MVDIRHSDYHKLENFSKNGTLGISSNVIIEITKKAIEDIDGISLVVPKSIFTRNSIEVRYNKRGELFIDVNIRVDYGFNASDVTKQVQDRIGHDLQYMTEINPKSINISIGEVSNG